MNMVVNRVYGSTIFIDQQEYNKNIEYNNRTFYWAYSRVSTCISSSYYCGDRPFLFFLSRNVQFFHSQSPSSFMFSFC